MLIYINARIMCNKWSHLAVLALVHKTPLIAFTKSWFFRNYQVPRLVLEKFAVFLNNRREQLPG